MSVKLKILILTFILISRVSYGQTGLSKISGIVFDSKNNARLANTNILLKNKNTGTVSNSKGMFTLTTGHLPETLIFSHIGYQTKLIKLRKSDSNLFIRVALFRDTIMLKEAIITGSKSIYNRKTNDYLLLDYTFIDSNILVLQNKLGFKRRKSLVLLSSSYDTLATSIRVPAGAISFFDDCLGNTHLLTADSAYQIWVNNKSIVFLKPVEIRQFYAILKNCLLMKDSSLFYRKSMMAGLGEEIYVFNSENNKPVLFIKSYDKEKYERYITDILHLSGLYPGHNIPIASVENDSFLMSNIRHFEVEHRFLKDIVYKPVFNHLFEIHDTLIYFNHINGSIDFFFPGLTPERSVPISYQKSKKWKNTVLKDLVTNKTYTLYYNAGYFDLYEVNYNSGNISREARIPAMSTHKIEVNNGYVYYLGTETFLRSTAVRKLHRRKLGNLESE